MFTETSVVKVGMRRALTSSIDIEHDAPPRRTQDKSGRYNGRLTSLFDQSALRTSLLSVTNVFKIFSIVAFSHVSQSLCIHRPLTISSFLALSARLVFPKALPVLFMPSKCFSTHSMSLRRNSVRIISISRMGSTSPST